VALVSNRQTESAADLPINGSIENARGDELSFGHVPYPISGRAVERFYSTATSLVIATLSVPWTFLASRKVQRVLLAIVILNVPFHISKHFFRQDTAAEFGAVGGLDISLSTIAIALLYLAWLTRARSAAFGPRRSRNQAIVPVLLLLLFYTLSLLVAGDATLGFFQVWSLLEACFLYFYISNAVTSREDVLFIVRLLLIGLILEDVFMLAQAGGLVGDIGGWGLKARTEYFGTNRVSGTIVSANLAAGYIAMIMALAFVVPFAKVRPTYKYLATISLITSTIPLVLTLSRSGWVSFCVSVTFIALFRGRVPWKAVFGLVAVVLLLAVPFSKVIGDRLSTDDNGAFEGRMPLNRVALLIIADHPITGVGANNFPLVMDSYAARGGLLGEWLYTVHNAYLLIWSETGIGGLLAFLWFLNATFRQGWNCWKVGDPLFSPIAIGCMAAIAGQMTQMCVDVFREGATYESLWLLAGLISAMYQLTTSLPRADAKASKLTNA
jgi:O-antigen ligase